MAYRTKADTRYRLMPTEPSEIIRCIIGSCLAVAAFFGIVHTTALIASVVL